MLVSMPYVGVFFAVFISLFVFKEKHNLLDIKQGIVNHRIKGFNLCLALVEDVIKIF